MKRVGHAHYPIPVMATVNWARSTQPLPIVALVVAILVGLVPPASAELGGSTDPDDAVRRDLATVSLRHHSGTHRYKWRFTTYERFRLPNGGSFVLFIDSVGAGRWDYRLFLWFDGGHDGIVCSGGPRAGVGGAQRFSVLRYNAKRTSGWCTFRPVRRTKPVRWRVMSAPNDHPHFGRPFDRAPNIGWL